MKLCKRHGVAEISQYLTGSKQCCFNPLLHRFTQLPAHIYLKDYLAFSGNHKPLTGFWEGTQEVLKLFAELSVSAAQVAQVAAPHLRRAPVIESLPKAERSALSGAVINP